MLSMLIQPQQSDLFEFILRTKLTGARSPSMMKKIGAVIQVRLAP
jgi:hypothetical protein